MVRAGRIARGERTAVAFMVTDADFTGLSAGSVVIEMSDSEKEKSDTETSGKESDESERTSGGPGDATAVVPGDGVEARSGLGMLLLTAESGGGREAAVSAHGLAMSAKFGAISLTAFEVSSTAFPL